VSEGQNYSGEDTALAPGEIKNLGHLDLTSMKSPEELDRIKSIENVGAILVPEPLMGRLAGIPMKNVGSTIAIPEGENVRLMTGQIKLTGEALASPGSEEDVLVVTGQLLITTPVEHVGYRKMVVSGQVMAPEGSEAALGAGISRLTGQIVYYRGTPRLFVGNDRVGSEFFELLDGPVTLIIAGNFEIEEGVPHDLLREKVAKIVLAGNLRAPEELIPLVQVLTEEKAGNISALDDEGEEEDE
jgi:hypothetical protein